MKTACILIVGFFAFQLAGQGQSNSPILAAAVASVSKAPTFRAVARGKDFTVMESVTQGKTNRYTAIGNGLNFQDSAGQWIEANPVIQSYAGGIVCTGASYSVILNQNLHQSGSVDLQAADGARVVSHPLALYFYDPESGKSVLLAQMQDSKAELSTNNEVIYRDAFAAVNGSGIQAAVTYRYQAGRFSQDVTLTTKPAITPADVGLGSKTRLEVASEIINSPAIASTPHVWKTETNAVLRAAMAEPDVVDETLTFGPELTMTLGRAFATEATPDRRATPGLPVAKRLVQAEGCTLVLESLEWNSAKSELDKLPANPISASPAIVQARSSRELPEITVSVAKESFESRLREVSQSSKAASNLVAFNSRNSPAGFVMDYTIVAGQECNYVFYPGTYWVQSDFDISIATFCPGAVIKYSQGVSLYASSSVSFPGGDSVIFTAVDDNTVGESLGNGDPQGYYAYWALYCYYVNYPITASQLDVRFAQNGIYCYLVDSSISSSAMSHCGLGFYADECTMTLGYPVTMCDVEAWYDCSGNHGGNGWIVDYGVGDGCGADSDFDGLNDAWEWQHFGNLSQTASGDPDEDGASNLQEMQASTDPNDPGSAPHLQLGQWRFNTSSWVGDQGQTPLSQVGLSSSLVSSIEEHAVDMTGTPYAQQLSYRQKEANGHVNLSLKYGTIVFWFKPNWSSTDNGGNGPVPGAWGRMINIGEWTYPPSYGFWSLCLDPSGTTITLGVQDDAGHAAGSAYPTIPGGFVAGRWYQIAVTYTPTGTAFYINGNPIGTSYGLNNVVPPQNILNGGFFVGSDTWGGNHSMGAFDLLQTFNYVLSANDIAANYATELISYQMAIDNDGDNLPDWWELKYFGTLSRDGTEDYDSDGITDLNEYAGGVNSTDPNTIVFSVSATNNYVSTTSTTLGIEEIKGHPFKIAWLRDSTDFSHASWTDFNPSSPSVTVDLGVTEAWHEVWIGLRGLPDDAQQTWQWKRLKLDRVPPRIVVTGPASTVTQPMIQLIGYSPEPLAGLRYDLTNAAGLVTNELGLVEGSVYNTNTWEFTTNWFQCYDIQLTNGVNIITLHASDRAGNTTTTNFSFTLDYSGKTNPPVVEVDWPQNGDYLSGTNFTVSGKLVDPTATIATWFVDTNGTNVIEGVVGRDGKYWIFNLPLANGTNNLPLTVTDVVGNTTTTNLTLIASPVLLTIDPVAAGQTTVTGTINTNGFVVWVNGVEATIDGYNWTGEIQPIGIGGGWVEATATGGGQSIKTRITVDPPQGIFVDSYHVQEHWDFPLVHLDPPEIDYGDEWEMTQHWINGDGGKFNLDNLYLDSRLPDYFSETVWDANDWPQVLPSGINNSWHTGYPVTTNTSDPVNLPQEHAEVDYNSYLANGTLQMHLHRTADTEMKLATGGPLGSTGKTLWLITATATNYPDGDTENGIAVPFEQIEIGNLGNLDTNGELYVVLPDNDPALVTPRVKWKSNYKFTVSGRSYPQSVMANSVQLLQKIVRNDANFCVGQGIYFNLGGDFPNLETQVKWTLPGTLVNRQPDQNCLAYFDKDPTLLTRNSVSDGTLTTSCWFVEGLQDATATAKVYYYFKKTGWSGPITLMGKFNVHRPVAVEATPYQPDGTPWVQIVGNRLSLGDGHRNNDMSFSHQINPGSFSGKAGYTQLVGFSGIDFEDAIHTYQNVSIDISPSNQLDNCEFPRGQPTVPANTNTSVKFFDGPQVSLANNLTETDYRLHFHTYLLFKPDAGPGPNIFVSLRKIEWELDAIAQPPLDILSDTAIITDDKPSSEFPHWTGIIYSSGWIW